MNRFVPLVVLMPVLVGCYSTTGTKSYSAVGLVSVYETTAAEKDKPQGGTPQPSVEELMARKVQLQFPAKLMIIDLARRSSELRLGAELEKILRDDSRFSMVELASAEGIGRRDWRLLGLDEIQKIGARYQAKYVLVCSYNINPYEMTYWVPAALAMCTLGAVPIPVGGMERFCSTKLVIMDVPSGVLLISMQGQGHADGTNILGGRTREDVARTLEQKALRAAVDDMTPNFKDKLARLAAQTKTTVE